MRYGSGRPTAPAPHVAPDEIAALKRIEQEHGLRGPTGRRSVARSLNALSELMTSNERAVVFCPTADLATELAEELEGSFRRKSVFCHVTTQRSEENERAVRSFEAIRKAAVLVADSSAEEGRNLQFADVLVHLGLPGSANRLEQRIGRCDRWSPEGSRRVAVICRCRDTRITHSLAPGAHPLGRFRNLRQLSRQPSASRRRRNRRGLADSPSNGVSTAPTPR